MMKFEPGQRIHLVGIGGSGMSAIARVLLEQGYSVSGSDRGSNELSEALARDGATVYAGHNAAYIAGTDMLIITSAVKDDHVEVAAARAAGIPVYKRQDVIAALMEGKKVIAVAGTKGKTTTASMIVHILRECGQDPSYIVGGVLGNTGTNAGVGAGEWFVVEADEYDNMFLGLRPDIAVITNIEWDHPDFFKTPADMVESFRQFVQLLPVAHKQDGKYKIGTLIVCAHDPVAMRIAEDLLFKRKTLSMERYIVSYGMDKTQLLSSFVAEEVKHTADGVSFEIPPADEQSDDPDPSTEVHLNLFGEHNVLNALAALAAIHVITRLPCAEEALATFKPTARRFDLRAEVGGVAVINDYAHNPMSIRATLDAAHQRYPNRELWAVWQPHTYSRTQALFDDFVTAFAAADHVLITDIYAAREQAIPGVSSAGVVAAMAHADVRHTPTFADAVNMLRAEVKAPAVILIMSAGDAPQIGIDYLKALQGAGE